MPVTAFVPSSRRGTRSWMNSKSSGDGDDAADFDPLLSPHAYPDGIDSGAISNDESKEMESTSSFGFGSIQYEEVNVSASSRITSDDDFDPTLSPHYYPDGVDAGVVIEEDSSGDRKQEKLGILLIDHGSKREASNEHLHNLAKIYQYNYSESKKKQNTVVRGAHMEIADPSILTSLRNLITVDQVTRIVCVPYFLSPGRHATTDVPNLLAEAKTVLNEEGALSLDGNDSIEIIMSDALGTHTESMLGAVDKLVDLALDKQTS